MANSPFRGVPLRARAIELMKQGHAADALHWQFVQEGADPEEVRAVLTELVALQQQAAAMDPARLRGEARWMFTQGATVEHVVAHFVRVGVPEADARREAQRLFEAFQRLKPCQRCGMPSEPSDLTFDLSGFTICKACNLQDEINRSEQRGLARELEMIGGGLGGIGGAVAASVVANAMMDGQHLGTSRPFCGRCRQPSGIHVSQVQPAMRARIDPKAEWVCGQCGTFIA